jgi:hypothetical protein
MRAAAAAQTPRENLIFLASTEVEFETNLRAADTNSTDSLAI